ncbi:acyl-CoA dehydrogenase, partial [Rhodococcus hoagii]|nr:acyl-CoA dehydrogenase [Prescottella equi]
MNLALTPQERVFRDEMRTFFRTEIPSEIRERVASGGSVSRDDLVATQRILNAAGLAVPHWPVQWGGRDWTAIQRHIWLDEMQLAAVPEPLAFNANMVGPVIAAFGSETQKERFLPATANLDIWWCQGFSEPGSGSDLASLQTRAVRDGDDYIVSGQKTWTTLAQYADWIFCLVRTDPNAPKKQAGISFLLIDLASPGVTVRPIKL